MFFNTKIKKAERYFKKRMKKIFIDGHSANRETFEEYLSYGYIDIGCHCCGYALMALEDDDCLVHLFDCHTFGIIEFKYKEEYFVFDPQPGYRGVFYRSEWYKKYHPTVDIKLSKKEIVKHMKLQCVENERFFIKEFDIHNPHYLADIYETGTIYFDKCNKISKFIGHDYVSV